MLERVSILVILVLVQAPGVVARKSCSQDHPVNPGPRAGVSQEREQVDRTP